jgi:octopine/nopaline transport system permease protein
MVDMIINLSFGLPSERPGGLLLTIIYAITSGIIALAMGLMYATITVSFPQWSLPIQAVCTFLRGIPVLLLIFLAQSSGLLQAMAGLVALALYSFSHVGEILRSFLSAYPGCCNQQARIMGLSPFLIWLKLKLPWTIRRAWSTLTTHWVSLLKDTGALVILALGELTTVAKALGETPTANSQWVIVFSITAILYFIATLSLIRVLKVVERLI